MAFVLNLPYRANITPHVPSTHPLNPIFSLIFPDIPLWRNQYLANVAEKVRFSLRFDASANRDKKKAGLPPPAFSLPVPYLSERNLWRDSTR